MVNVLASMLFGGISGSSVADTSSIGSILIPMMRKAGYDNDYSVAVTISSSVQGVIIPPSHNVIIYAVAALITTSSAYGYMMARLDIPQLVTNSLIHLTDNRYFIFLIINLILLGLGMIMDMAPLILITTPILLPVVANFGMDPHQFGIVMMLNLGMGLLTPPVGSTLFVGCAIGRVRIEDMVIPMIPFYISMFITLMLITYIPQISLWLPGFFK